MSSSDGLDVATVVLLVLVAVVVLPMIVMWFGFGGMMGYEGMMGPFGDGGGWWPFVGMFVPLALLLVLLGVGYFLLRGALGGRSARDPAIAELRAAYARGELSDEEFERRRERLERRE